MTDNEIIKALRVCGNDTECKKCPYFTNSARCVNDLMSDALDLIIQRKREIEELKSLCISKDVIIDEQEAQIEGLRNITEIEIECKALRLASEAVEEVVKDFAKKMVDAVDEGLISHSSDIVDFAVEYLEGLKKK